MKGIIRWVGLLTLSMVVACQPRNKENASAGQDGLEPQRLTKETAALIFELPKHCLGVEYPNKMGQVLGSAQDLKGPKALRPIFYGCYDWHSSVHGYWSIVRLMRTYPALDADGRMRQFLKAHITPENLAVEMAFFHDKNNLSFERTYGWAWLLKLQEELLSWGDADAKVWARTLQPLATLLSERTQVYLTKLIYPIRTGQHDNTAFSLSLMLDYAEQAQDHDLRNAILVNSARFFAKDEGCSLAYEPSGSDFLSPCLEEAYLMSRILPQDKYEPWLADFMPVLFEEGTPFLQPALVSDRTDGKLVHLDGLNFSRAHCLYGIAKAVPRLHHDLVALGNTHIDFSLKNISNDDYMGSHWLGSFALLALSH